VQSARMTARPGPAQPPFPARGDSQVSLAQQSSGLCSGVVDLDLMHRIGRLQFSDPERILGPSRCVHDVGSNQSGHQVTINTSAEIA